MYIAHNRQRRGDCLVDSSLSPEESMLTSGRRGGGGGGGGGITHQLPQPNKSTCNRRTTRQSSPASPILERAHTWSTPPRQRHYGQQDRPPKGYNNTNTTNNNQQNVRNNYHNASAPVSPASSSTMYQQQGYVCHPRAFLNNKRTTGQLNNQQRQPQRSSSSRNVVPPQTLPRLSAVTAQRQRDPPISNGSDASYDVEAPATAPRRYHSESEDEDVVLSRLRRRQREEGSRSTSPSYFPDNSILQQSYSTASLSFADGYNTHNSHSTSNITQYHASTTASGSSSSGILDGGTNRNNHQNTAPATAATLIDSFSTLSTPEPRRLRCEQGDRRYHHHYDFPDRPDNRNSSYITDFSSNSSRVVVTPPDHSLFNNNHHRHRYRMALGPLPVEPHDAIIVRVGGVEFVHSRLILCYASAVLAQHLLREPPPPPLLDDETTSTTAALTVSLDIPHKPAEDWQALRAFLEPHAVQPAALGAHNLPVLLPWFRDLQLSVLLRECDELLCRHAIFPDGSGSNDNDENESHNVAQNLLLLCKIAVRARLEHTAEAAFSAAAAWLQQRPDLWLQPPSAEQQQQEQANGNGVQFLQEMAALLLQCLRPEELSETAAPATADDSDEKDTTMNSSTVDESSDRDLSSSNDDDDGGIDIGVEEKKIDISTSTPPQAQPAAAAAAPPPFEPQASAKLFVAAISYLPPDCLQALMSNSTNPMAELLSNALFPYLAREAMLRQKQQQQQQQIQDVSLVASSADDNDDCERNGETPHPEQQQQPQQQPFNPATSVLSAGSAIASDFHAGLHRLLLQAGLGKAERDGDESQAKEVESQAEDDDRTPNRWSFFHGLNGSGLLEPASEETAWLELIWHSLNEPPGLVSLPSAAATTTTARDSASSAVSDPTRRRTFAC